VSVVHDDFPYEDEGPPPPIKVSWRPAPPRNPYICDRSRLARLKACDWADEAARWDERARHMRDIYRDEQAATACEEIAKLVRQAAYDLIERTQ
jgi:hypothetical protein